MKKVMIVSVLLVHSVSGAIYAQGVGKALIVKAKDEVKNEIYSRVKQQILPAEENPDAAMQKALGNYKNNLARNIGIRKTWSFAKDHLEAKRMSETVAIVQKLLKPSMQQCLKNFVNESERIKSKVKVAGYSLGGFSTLAGSAYPFYVHRALWTSGRTSYVMKAGFETAGYYQTILSTAPSAVLKGFTGTAGVPLSVLSKPGEFFKEFKTTFGKSSLGKTFTAVGLGLLALTAIYDAYVPVEDQSFVKSLGDIQGEVTYEISKKALFLPSFKKHFQNVMLLQMI